MAAPKIGSIGPDGNLVTGKAVPPWHAGEVITEQGVDGSLVKRYVTTAETIGRVGLSSRPPEVNDASQESLPPVDSIQE